MFKCITLKEASVINYGLKFTWIRYDGIDKMDNKTLYSLGQLKNKLLQFTDRCCKNNLLKIYWVIQETAIKW